VGGIRSILMRMVTNGEEFGLGDAAGVRSGIEPYRIAVPDSDLDDLRLRVQRTRWPDAIPGSQWTYGSAIDVIRPLAEYWADGYEWRRHEAELNEVPQFVTHIDGQRIHFQHVRSAEPGAVPLLLIHGWPGSIAEFRHIVDPLVDPTAHGGDRADAFHVVVPSLPGNGFSGPTSEPGWDALRVAECFDTLMGSLGYNRYCAQGGDWGSMIARHLGILHPEHLVGIHLNFLPEFGPGRDDDMDDVSELEAAILARRDDMLANGTGYVAIQSTRPQTLAFGLTDSPVGLLSWIAEKFWTWTDHDGELFDAVSRDDLLTDVSIYWFTGTAGSSARLYYESARTGSIYVPPFRDTPIGVASFPKEALGTRRRWVEAGYDLRHWTDLDRGGHFAAMEEPDLLVNDVREFFRPLRSTRLVAATDGDEVVREAT